MFEMDSLRIVTATPSELIEPVLVRPWIWLCQPMISGMATAGFEPAFSARSRTERTRHRLQQSIYPMLEVFKVGL